MIEYHIPRSPSKYDRPWYVMPKAIPYKEVLSHKSWESVVKDFIELATALSHMHAQGVSHRDIKLENVLYHDKKIVLSDFGLVKCSNESNITEERRDVGAKFTMAPEMRRHAYRADGCAADVYSFAKTLWIALTKDDFCFDGQYMRDSSLSLSKYNGNMYLATLEKAISSATANDPKERPDILSFSDELKEWMRLISDWEMQSKKTWKDISNFTFPTGVPEVAKWSKFSDIADVLNTFSKVKSPNYMFYPDGGGHHLVGCFVAGENGFIELHVGERDRVILKPDYLLFESLGGDPLWDYFRLKASTVDYKFPEEYTGSGVLNEELLEVKPGVYRNINIMLDESADLPNTFRKVYRCVSGTFLIVNTNSIYNKLGGWHDANNGQYNRMSDGDFRNFALKLKAREELGDIPKLNNPK